MSFCMSLNLPVYVSGSKTWSFLEVQLISTTHRLLQSRPRLFA